VQVSVIVPMYNAERTLAACLDGLAAQDHPRGEHEILLVDNGSTDASASIARRHPGVTLLSEPRPGAYAARNHGLRRAQGDVIAFTDPDCVPHPSWIREIVSAHPGGCVLVVSHKATLRLVLSSLLGFEPRGYRDRLDQSPACLNVVDFRDPVHARLMLFNDTSHYDARPRGPHAALSKVWDRA